VRCCSCFRRSPPRPTVSVLVRGRGGGEDRSALSSATTSASTRKEPKQPAVSGIGMTATSLLVPPKITLDHPFLLLIRDTKPGTILFAAQI
jgi:hypothetical protein